MTTPYHWEQVPAYIRKRAVYPEGLHHLITLDGRHYDMSRVQPLKRMPYGTDQQSRYPAAAEPVEDGEPRKQRWTEGSMISSLLLSCWAALLFASTLALWYFKT